MNRPGYRTFNMPISYLSFILGGDLRDSDYVLKGRHTFYGNVSIYVSKEIIQSFT